MSSIICGCYCCTKTFKESDIEDFVDDGLSALCPYCMVDSVIVVKDMNDKDELVTLQSKYFSVD